MNTIPYYLKPELMKSFDWSSMVGVTPHEAVLLLNMSKLGGYDLEILEAVELWILFSVTCNAQFLDITWDQKENYTKFIGKWLKENTILEIKR